MNTATEEQEVVDDVIKVDDKPRDSPGEEDENPSWLSFGFFIAVIVAVGYLGYKNIVYPLKAVSPEELVALAPEVKSQVIENNSRDRMPITHQDVSYAEEQLRDAKDTEKLHEQRVAQDKALNDSRLPNAAEAGKGVAGTPGALRACTKENSTPPCQESELNPLLPRVSITQIRDIPAVLSPGQKFEYIIIVINTGKVAADQTLVTDPKPEVGSNLTWTCVGQNGAVCGAQGTGALSDRIRVFPPGGKVVYTIVGTVDS